MILLRLFAGEKRRDPGGVRAEGTEAGKMDFGGEGTAARSASGGRHVA